MANGIAKINIKLSQSIPRPFHYPLRRSALIRLQASPTSKALKVVSRERQNKSPSRNLHQKAPKKQCHLWKRKSTAGSGKRSRALVETVAKWMLSKGQGMTMGTYDTMILAFDMEGRVDDAQTLWDIISSKHSRSMPKMMFSRMISMYDKHNMPGRLLEIFTDLEELDIKPDESTLKKVAYAFSRMGLEDKRNEVLLKYGPKWKYLYFNGEQVRVRVEDLENMKKL